MSSILILLDVIGFELNLNVFMGVLLNMRPMRSLSIILRKINFILMGHDIY